MLENTKKFFSMILITGLTLSVSMFSAAAQTEDETLSYNPVYSAKVSNSGSLGNTTDLWILSFTEGVKTCGYLLFNFSDFPQDVTAISTLLKIDATSTSDA